MTLKEAIQHCEEVAKGKCNACGAEHEQLAEWLRELQLRRDSEKKWVAMWTLKKYPPPPEMLQAYGKEEENAIAAWNRRVDND